MSLFQSIWSQRVIDFYNTYMLHGDHIIITYGIYNGNSVIFTKCIGHYTMSINTACYGYSYYDKNYSRPDDVVIYDGPVLPTDYNKKRFFLEYCRKKIYKFHGFEDIAILAY
jgi:hypothetical protein